MMYWQDNNSSGWGFAVMIISMVLFWALIIGGIALAVRYTRRHPSSVHSKPSAEDLLAERYARGDIDDDDYHARLSTLRKHTQH